jgi:hypothetical protein
LSATETIGNFNTPELGKAVSLLRLTVPVKDFSSDWRRYNLVANYLAEYSAYRFQHKDKAENLISSVFYELIEHMVAISRHEAKLDIRFCTGGGSMLFELTSSLSADALQRLTENLNELLQTDIDHYYLGLLEQDMEQPGIRRIFGLVMIAHDYHARLSASVEAETGSVTLRTCIAEGEINS